VNYLSSDVMSKSTNHDADATLAAQEA